MSINTYLATLQAEPILKLNDISLYSDGSQIYWIVLNLLDRPVNVLNPALTSQFKSIIDYLENGIKNNQIKVIIFTSGKKESFLAGADVTAIYPIVDSKVLKDLALLGQEGFNRLEALNVPTIAAINGTCLGGGLELALSCTYRLCADHKKVELGLPEVKLGLIPGASGTVRLPRLIGLQNALQIILPGGSVKPKKAKAIGLVDKVLPYTDRYIDENIFYSSVREFAISKIGTSPKRNYHRTESYQDWFLNSTTLGNYVVSSTAVKNLDNMSKGKYPASYQALDSVINSLNTDMKNALVYEATNFGKCGASPESKALTSLFFMIEDSKKVKGKINADPKRVKKVGVIGAGVMGAQIAQICASKKLNVYMRDIKDDLVTKGLKFVADIYQSKVDKKRMTPEIAAQFTSLVKGGVDIKPFKECEVLIEAAVEQMALKKKILAECEATCGDNTIFATNTSSLSINELAESAKRPQTVVGLHFFNPVSKMPLVEVIRGKKTSDEAVATAYQLALDLGKVPVVCGDCPGFVVNRILGIYMNEAGIIVMEGQDFTHVDSSLLRFGMPMGPMRLMDEVGLDVAGHVGPILEQGLGVRYKQIPQFAKILKENAKYLGKKTGSGFYHYDAKGKQLGVNSAIKDQIIAVQKKGKSALPLSEISDRCVLIMLNEAAYILSEGIVSRPEDLDLAMVMGTGFAPFTGGLLNYADSRGIKKCVDKLLELEKKYGFRFKPHPLLVKMASNNEFFFPNRPRGMVKISSNPRSKL